MQIDAEGDQVAPIAQIRDMASHLMLKRWSSIPLRAHVARGKSLESAHSSIDVLICGATFGKLRIRHQYRFLPRRSHTA